MHKKCIFPIFYPPNDKEINLNQYIFVHVN